MKRSLLPGIALALFVAVSHLFAWDDSKYNAPETPKIRESFTVVPETNDINELREFINNSFENWSPQMQGRYKDYEDYELFLKEKALAQVEAADRMLELCREQGIEVITEVEDKDMVFMIAREDASDYTFALKNKASGYYQLNDDKEYLKKYEEYVEYLESDPAKKEIADYARMYLFCGKFYHTWHLDGEAAVAFFQKTHDELKAYLDSRASDPLLLQMYDHMFFIERQCAEVVESFPKAKIKKGTLMLPALEMYKPVFAKSEEQRFQDHSSYIDRELLKYNILAADDPMAAFRKAVDEKKVELEKQLDEDSRMNLWPLEGAAEAMEQRIEALKYFYTTLRPVFAASDEDFAKVAVVVYDMELNQLALIGKEFELEAVLMDGVKIDLKDYRGKVVLVEYWNTGCGPCIGEFPTLKNVYEAYHDKGLEIIAFSTDEDLDALKAMIEEKQLPWLNASEKLSKEQNLPDSRKKYNINSYPTSILIGKDGKVVRSDARGMILFQELPKLISSER